jgi:hypothetical protein
MRGRLPGWRSLPQINGDQSMNKNPASPELISEDEARGKVEQYLRQRYHEFDKVQFISCDLNGVGADQYYRFQGKIMLKSRSNLDRFVMEKAAGYYTFTFDMGAVNGQVINYVFN